MNIPTLEEITQATQSVNRNGETGSEILHLAIFSPEITRETTRIAAYLVQHPDMMTDAILAAMAQGVHLGMRIVEERWLGAVEAHMNTARSGGS